MKIWIDADATPRDVKEIVFRAAKRLGLPVVLVANQPLRPPANNSLVTAVWVDGGADVADQHIAAEAVKGDLVVTQDVPLAALRAERGDGARSSRRRAHARYDRRAVVGTGLHGTGPHRGNRDGWPCPVRRGRQAGLCGGARPGPDTTHTRARHGLIDPGLPRRDGVVRFRAPEQRRQHARHRRDWRSPGPRAPSASA